MKEERCECSHNTTKNENEFFRSGVDKVLPRMPEVFLLTSGEECSERVVLVSERPLAHAVKSFERADPIALLHVFISPESRFDPGNLIGRLKKRFLKRAVIG